MTKIVIIFILVYQKDVILRKRDKLFQKSLIFMIMLANNIALLWAW